MTRREGEWIGHRRIENGHARVHWTRSNSTVSRLTGQAGCILRIALLVTETVLSTRPRPRFLRVITMPAYDTGQQELPGHQSCLQDQDWGLARFRINTIITTTIIIIINSALGSLPTAMRTVRMTKPQTAHRQQKTNPGVI